MSRSPGVSSTAIGALQHALVGLALQGLVLQHEAAEHSQEGISNHFP